MSNREKIIQLIKEAETLRSLFEKIIKCIGDFDDKPCLEIMQEIEDKIDQFKKTDQELLRVSKRSLRSERLAAVGQMAAAISHELRNPLSGIKVAAEYLLRKSKDYPELTEIVNNIHNEVIFANSIISNILEYAKISKPNLIMSKIESLVNDALLTVAQQGWFKNIEIKKQFAPNLPQILIDQLQVRQVFMNLFINSAEAMVRGGTLLVKVDVKEDMMVIRISDTGSGIDQEHFEKLFEPFFTTKVKGIGLGLAIAKEIIENHDGEIDIQSKAKKGTTVSIYLPVKNEG